MDAFGHLTGETEGPSTVAIARTYYPQTGEIATMTAGRTRRQHRQFFLRRRREPRLGLGSVRQSPEPHRQCAELRRELLWSLSSGRASRGPGDTLNRLTAYAVNDGGGGTCDTGTIQKSIAYDAGGAGNIATKSDLGTYNYGGTAFNPAPHAVTSITTTAPLYGLTNPSLYGAGPPAALRADRGTR